jgi:hypothetical protein
MSGKVTVRNGDNSTVAGTALPWTGTKAVSLGFESITVTCLATQDTVMTLYTGITDSTMSAVRSITCSANIPAVISQTVTASHFYVAVSGGAGTIEVETLLHHNSTTPRLTLQSDSTGALVVPTATTLTHDIDLGASITHAPITVGLFLTSDDTTATAFARQASYDGVVFFTIDKFTTATAQTFQTISSDGVRYLRILYSNGSGVDKNITISSSYWQ